MVLCHMLLGETLLLKLPPPLAAAAIMYACRRGAGVCPPWPLALEALTGYHGDAPALTAALQLVEGYITKVCCGKGVVLSAIASKCICMYGVCTRRFGDGWHHHIKSSCHHIEQGLCTMFAEKLVY